MRPVLACCFVLLIALPCSAQGGKPKPNTLSAKEIADGWVLLFDGETTFGWEPYHGEFERSPRSKEPRAEKGALALVGDSAISTTMMFPDFELGLEYKLNKKTGYGSMMIHGAEQKHPFDLPDTKDSWRIVSVHRNKGKLQVETPTDKSTGMPWTDPIKILFLQFPEADLRTRNLKLRPLNMKSLFNGKDLTGWKEFPGKKSKFAIIDGAINVKDGPGDLQTVGKYRDFILQLDCISNGKHLNSGIFFRCRDNEYQNGYEAQIRNEFKAEATQKYQIEEYDPKTHKLLGKKEQLFTAVDYGTGAIYRRHPARKQMSKDGEWFTMTIVAHGNHLATWVNGVQVTDWYDNRPKSDNARTGCRLEAGHISIQGHDPTTNLSFKNIRIAELK
ncbi:MAG: DUF1080 domain-containing protein [Planctomycetes bacterium]|nr:DUF1080 domain-containing protein [Planctomycetota bacterium]